MQKNGFSLLETLIALVILCLSLVMLFSIFVLAQKFYQRGEVEAELLQNGRIIIERISREARQAAEMVSALPLSEIEFQDGHNPSPYDYLNSDYYYVRYYLDAVSHEFHRQYRVYCFDDCSLCSSFYRWNDKTMQDGQEVFTHACDLEDYVVGEYVSSVQFSGAGVINFSLTLSHNNQTVYLKSAVFGRDL